MKLKLAFAYDSAYPWFNGGIEKRRFLIMQALAHAGHEVHCFTMLREGMPGKEFSYKGIRYHCCGVAIPNSKMYVHGRRNMRWPLKYALILPFKLIRYDNFDLIDADAFPFLHLFTISLIAKLKRIKFIVTWHEVWSLEYWKRYLGKVGGIVGYFVEYLASKLTKDFISNSNETAKRLYEEFGKKSLVFPAAVSSYEFDATHIKKKDQFISIGRLVPEKRMDMVLRAIAESNTSAKIIGMGPEEKNLKALAKELGIEKKVRFIRRLSPKKLFASIKESQGLLMFSEREGLSLITLEAMMLGVPVFIVGSTSLPSDVKKLCIKLDEKNLGKSINEVLKNYREYEEKAKRARQIVLERYSADYALQVYEKFLK